ncbi:hypothetical protein Tco_0034876 [Tanacetum coccineum]
MTRLRRNTISTNWRGNNGFQPVGIKSPLKVTADKVCVTADKLMLLVYKLLLLVFRVNAAGTKLQVLKVTTAERVSTIRKG